MTPPNPPTCLTPEQLAEIVSEGARMEDETGCAPMASRPTRGSPPTCQWFDGPDPLGDDTEAERCTSGKPALFQNCGLVGVPVCEDHKCRCRGKTHGAPLPPDFFNAVVSGDEVECSGCSQLSTLVREQSAELAELRGRVAWVPVGERLPEDGLEKLVVVRHNGHPYTRTARYAPRDIDGLPEWSVSDVTHWMPLPTPPTEAK